MKKYSDLEYLRLPKWKRFLYTVVCCICGIPTGILNLLKQTGLYILNFFRAVRDEFVDIFNTFRYGDYKTKISFAEKMIDNFEKATGVKIRDYIEEIEISTPMTYARYTDAPAGTIYGYEASKEDGIVKRIVFDMIDKGIQGLYFAGGYTTRHMGYSPSYTTGDMAAKAAVLAMEKEAK